jgi:hypothetical protein
VAQVHVQRTIAAPPQQVFDWLLDPANPTVSPVISEGRLGKGLVGPRRVTFRHGTGAARRGTLRQLRPRAPRHVEK